MREIQSIALIGAGAVGALYVSLFQAQGTGVTIIAAGERAERLKKNGFRVNEIDYHPLVVEPSSSQARPHDLVLIAVKYHQLDEAIHLIKPFVGDGTIILSLLNGIDSEERVAKAYGNERLLYSYVVGTDSVRTGNSVVYHNKGKIVFGERDGGIASDKVSAVKAAFDRGRIPYEVPADMMRSMWWKFMVNVGVNQASALLGAPYGVFIKIEEANSIMVAAMREVIAVSQKLNIDLNEKDIEAWYPVIAKLSPEGKTSMLQDMEAGQKTEVEMFAGTMVRLGRELGVPVPVNELLFDAIRAKEKMHNLLPPSSPSPQ